MNSRGVWSFFWYTTTTEITLLFQYNPLTLLWAVTYLISSELHQFRVWPHRRFWGHCITGYRQKWWFGLIEVSSAKLVILVSCSSVLFLYFSYSQLISSKHSGSQQNNAWMILMTGGKTFLITGWISTTFVLFWWLPCTNTFPLFLLLHLLDAEIFVFETVCVSVSVSVCVCVRVRAAKRKYEMTAKGPSGLTSSTFMFRSYLLFCQAEWWSNNMHYPCHQPQGSIIPVLLVRPGSPRPYSVSFPAHIGDLSPNFHSWTDWYAWGKGQTVEQMKWECEDEEMCWLNIWVNGTLDFSFPI